MGLLEFIGEICGVIVFSILIIAVFGWIGILGLGVLVFIYFKWVKH